MALAGPFSGILVVDLTHVLNGPFGTSMLCDLGARVVKVEPPVHGDDTRAYGPFVAANRSISTSSTAARKASSST